MHLGTELVTPLWGLTGTPALPLEVTLRPLRKDSQWQRILMSQYILGSQMGRKGTERPSHWSRVTQQMVSRTRLETHRPSSGHMWPGKGWVSPSVFLFFLFSLGPTAQGKGAYGHRTHLTHVPRAALLRASCPRPLLAPCAVPSRDRHPRTRALRSQCSHSLLQRTRRLREGN